MPTHRAKLRRSAQKPGNRLEDGGSEESRSILICIAKSQNSAVGTDLELPWRPALHRRPSRTAQRRGPKRRRFLEGTPRRPWIAAFLFDGTNATEGIDQGPLE